MGKLIHIDNGGTLTDFCVIDGERVVRTKILTTPHDLSACFLDGLRKVSGLVYGEEDLIGLLTSTDHIRYSTTQGTNALVERKGPRLGLVACGDLDPERVRAASGSTDLFDRLVGERVVRLDATAAPAALETAAVRAVSTLTSAGANRLVVAHAGTDRAAVESRVKRILLQKFPPHLLGAIPILYSTEIVADDDDVRRTWTALLNAFLHPAMEGFLYNAEQKLRAHKAKNPLLIFRNDGHSARVAKTAALMTYSSGPRGGMEAARAVAAHYDFPHLVSMDVGGTTTDIGEVKDGEVRVHPRGTIDGVAISFPLCNVKSFGVGGSSILKVAGGRIRVGPESVGSAPGPACFGLGGQDATITDALLLAGVLDAATFFGGELRLDRDRARAAIEANVAKPLERRVEDAASEAESAWVAKVAESIAADVSIGPETVLAAFGGAGPLVVCRIAEATGISRVLIPGLAAVFSAFGVGFSDVQHQYEATLDRPDTASLEACLATLEQRARRGMFAEGFALEDCDIERKLRLVHGHVDEVRPLDGALPSDLPPDARLLVVLSATKRLPHPSLAGRFGARHTAKANGERRVLREGRWSELPVYRVEEQTGGASAAGPAILEEAYFTARIDPGWRFEINDGGDVLLGRG